MSSFVGILEYILVISKDENFNFDRKEFQVSHVLNGQFFFALKVYGRGTCILSFLDSILASLQTGAFFQFTVSLMGESSLCIFIKPLIIGEVGFRLMYLER